MIPNRLALPASSLRRVLIALVTFAVLATALTPAVMAKPGGGNSPNAKLCQKGGWEDVVRQDQTPFANEKECVAYAAMGGTLTAPLPCGGVALDTALTGKTIYAIAYTNVDGVNGYSAAGCDVFHAALVEDSGDTTAGAGDLILMGRRPTSFDAPYNFVAVGGTSADVDSVNCHFSDLFAVRAPLGTGVVFWEATSVSESVNSNISEGGLAEYDYYGSTPDDWVMDAGGFIVTRNDQTDNPFLDVDIFVSCF